MCYSLKYLKSLSRMGTTGLTEGIGRIGEACCSTSLCFCWRYGSFSYFSFSNGSFSSGGPAFIRSEIILATDEFRFLQALRDYCFTFILLEVAFDTTISKRISDVLISAPLVCPYWFSIFLGSWLQ